MRAPSRLLLWGAVALYLAFIFVLSSIAHPPELPNGSDKRLHAVLYAGLGMLLARALAGGLTRTVTRGMVVTTTVLSGLYGVSDEIHQIFVPPRQVEVLDVVADTIGGALGAIALYAWGIIQRRSWPSRTS
ncbi:MAG: teicoplanin resistance protein VanZ [Acidobacteria bacterium]|nr:MAG: teicoplanin resistance protein VanZ [Acidobacteriota bacterium]PYR50034.1 MAG: teicoplanin resistance protein VanZ [Acidobacteriota bacterium]